MNKKKNKLSLGGRLSMILLLVGIVILVLTVFSKDNIGGIWVIATFFVLVFDVAMFFYFIAMTIREKKEKFCPECKEQHDFENDIEYREIKRYTKEHHVNPNSNAKQREESLTYLIRFDCTCGKCNKKRTYNKKIYGGAEYTDGSVDIRDPEEAIEDFFQSPGLSLNKFSFIIATFFSGALAILLSMIMAFAPSSTLDATKYYGTYRGVSDNFGEYTLVIDEDECKLTIKDLMKEASVKTYYDGDWEIYSESYMSKKYKTDGFEDCPALILGETYIFWITDEDEDGATFTAKFTSGSVVDLTKDGDTLQDVTKDPKNYLGQYVRSSSNKLVISNTTCELTLDGVKKTYSYIYANKNMLTKLQVSGVDKAIIVYEENSGEYYWFAIKDGDLWLQNKYEYVKK